MRQSLLFFILFLSSVPELGISAIRVAPVSTAVISIESENEKRHYKKPRFKFFQKLKDWFKKKKDWLGDGGLGKIALFFSGLLLIAFLLTAPSWLLWSLLALTVIFIVQSLIVGGDNIDYLVTILKTYIVYALIIGLVLFYVSRRTD
jgi:hypothetical protein